MDLFCFFRKNKKEVPEEVPEIEDLSCYGKKSTEELIRQYKFEKWMIEGKENRNQGMLPKEKYKDIEKLESEIISRIPDEFEKKVLRIVASFGLNIVEYMNNKWDEKMKSTGISVCHFLRFGNVYPLKEQAYNPLPFTGHELLIWLISNAGDDKNNRINHMMKITGTEFRKDNFFGYDFSDKNVRKEKWPPLLDSVGGRIVVIFGGPQFEKWMKVMIEIWKMEDGEGKKYLKDILKDMP